ncbi:NifU family protein [Patescibacteria group bacterium]|nr:NifU family protein [Patescibacteria group bacterium]MBU1921833.1 NifU family protein [Patescibacteria group bacterium]
MEIERKIKQKCEELRAGLQADGGDLELVKVDLKNRRVQIRLKGACVGCPFSAATLKQFIEGNLKQVWPELKEVVAVE